MTFRFAVLFCLCAAALPASAAVVGTSQRPEGLSEARIETLPAAERGAWLAYLKRSAERRAADKAALAAERAGLSGPVPPPPAESSHDASMPLERYPEWYASPEARHIADVIVSFQTPAGGWGKNQNFAGGIRQPGQEYVPSNLSAYLAAGDFDAPREPKWNYVGTLDNDATTTQLRFLALAIQQAPGREGDAWRAGFVRGVRYLLDAQYPNGGWPQVWPLEGGYHDAITYNDNAVTLCAGVLRAVGENTGGEYDFVPAELRARAGEADRKALGVILKTQIAANGVRTVWGQQHDALTLQPVAARNYEPALPSTEESADLLIYLMKLPDPSPQLQGAIRDAVAWLKRVAITGYEFTGKDTPEGRKLAAKAGAGPIWARYYTADGRPRFGERDKTIHDDVDELSKERRDGYSWFNTAPAKAIKAFDKWAKAHP
jgi:PelA/Pel-15E family pectate lyase